MSELLPKSGNQLIELTADIVAAYVSNNSIRPDDMPNLIADVFASIKKLSVPEAQAEEAPKPRMPIKKTVTHEYIISLEDGKQYRTLKRHLSGVGLTPDQYRAKWSLPADYPMVAPGYAQQRSELAKKLGLGRKPGAKQPAKLAPGKAKV